MAPASREDDSLIPGINVTPLVDVVLVLLVVLMVTAGYVARRALPIEPPPVHASSASPALAFEVTLDASGQASVDGAAVDAATLRALAGAYATRTPAAERRALVAADRAAAHGDVVAVLDTVRGVEITHVAIRVRQLPP